MSVTLIVLTYSQFPDVPTYFSTLMSKSLDRREGHYKAWLDLGPPAVGREERLFKPSTTKSG
jgi:hypothetical protein